MENKVDNKSCIEKRSSTFQQFTTTCSEIHSASRYHAPEVNHWKSFIFRLPAGAAPYPMAAILFRGWKRKTFHTRVNDDLLLCSLSNVVGSASSRCRLHDVERFHRHFMASFPAFFYYPPVFVPRLLFVIWTQQIFKRRTIHHAH